MKVKVTISGTGEEGILDEYKGEIISFVFSDYLGVLAIIRVGDKIKTARLYEIKVI